MNNQRYIYHHVSKINNVYIATTWMQSNDGSLCLWNHHAENSESLVFRPASSMAYFTNIDTGFVPGYGWFVYTDIIDWQVFQVSSGVSHPMKTLKYLLKWWNISANLLYNQHSCVLDQGFPIKIYKWANAESSIPRSNIYWTNIGWFSAVDYIITQHHRNQR